MNQSNRILTRIQNLKNYTNSNLATQAHSLRFSVQERSCLVHFDVTDEKLVNVKFSGDLGEWEPIFDLYLDLMQNQLLADAKKIDVREYDHYLRDTPSQKVFDFYPDALFHIVKLPWSIEEKLKGNQKQKPFYSSQKHGNFFELPLSMQLELLEDYFAEYNTHGCHFEDLDGNKLLLQLSAHSNTAQLLQDLFYHFQSPFITALP